MTPPVPPTPPDDDDDLDAVVRPLAQLLWEVARRRRPQPPDVYGTKETQKAEEKDLE
jgi:hypothetical protein